MKRTQNLSVAILDRRGFCSSIVGWAVSIVVAKVSFGAEPSLIVASADEEFVFVNGWVLTREDVTGIKE